MGRTRIVIDEDLVREAMKVTGARTRRNVVELALRRMIDMSRRHLALRAARGQLPWQGDLDAWRRPRE